VSDKMKKAILKKKGENVSVYKLMIMKWKDKKDMSYEYYSWQKIGPN
jgi:hypothetical protein